MPAHGLHADLEFGAILALGAIASVFLTGSLVSNVLFSSLLVSLFFLLGLHLDADRLRAELHKKRELAVGLLAVYGLVPLLAYLISLPLSSPLSDGVIAVGISTAAMGSPTVFSSIGDGDSGSAMVVAASSVFAGLIAVPVLVDLFGSTVDLSGFAVRNFGLVFLPFLAGLGSQKLHSSLIEDLRHNFSRLGLYLLAAIFFIQLRRLFPTPSIDLLELLLAVPVFFVFVVLSYSLSMRMAELAGLEQRQANSIGYVAGSKGLAVSLLVASVMSAGTVVYVTLYYFVRQAVLGGLAEYRSGKSRAELAPGVPSILKRSARR